MSLQRSPINGSALNGAVLAAVFASAVLAGVGSVSAPASRKDFIAATFAGSAGVSSSAAWQTHSARANAIQPAAINAAFSVKQLCEAAFAAQATFAAACLPTAGGAEFGAIAVFDPEPATLVQPGRVAGGSSSGFSSTAYRWLWVSAPIRPTLRFSAEPGVKLNGDSFWTFEASAAPMGQGAVSFTASGIRIVSYDSVFYGAADWQPVGTYKHRTSATLTAVSAVSPPLRQGHLAPVNAMNAAAITQATGVRHVNGAGTLGCAATAQAASKCVYAGQATFSAQVAVQPNVTRFVFHGYPVFTAAADMAASGPDIFTLAYAAPMGFAVTEMTADANLRSLDVVSFLRAPETRDILRAPETRLFTRYAT